jgi:hypothetical protein
MWFSSLTPVKWREIISYLATVAFLRLLSNSQFTDLHLPLNATASPTNRQYATLHTGIYVSPDTRTLT